MKRLFLCLVATMIVAGLVAAGCSGAAPASAPTQNPAAKPTTGAASTPAAAPAPTAAPKVEYPTKGRPITIIVPFAPGGANDITARVQADFMTKDLGTSVEVVNKPGASTQVGMTELAQSKPDGYNIGMLTLPGVPLAYLDADKKATYGRKDFDVVALQTWDPNGLAVAADSPYKTLKDLVDAAKSKPGQIKIGTSGLMSTDHMVILLLQKAAGITVSPVHFDGGAQSITSLLGGHLDAVVTTSSTFLPQFKSGQIRMLGIADKEQLAFFPGVPTFESQGYNVQYGASRGLVVRAGTPKEIIDILGNDAKKAIDDPNIRKKMDDLALTMRYMDQKQASTFWDNLDAQTKPLIEMAK
jgi:tripartite-type tricarboxylate transporter receptor subunit TctC